MRYRRCEMTAHFTRRALIGAGAGLFVLFRAGRASAQEHAPMPPYPSDWSAYLRIGADGRVTCFSGKVELGQGAMTSLAQCLAEELEVPFEAVDLIMGDTDLCPWDYGTVGSMCTPLFVPEVRKAGAEARAVLIQMAAERWDVPAELLTVHRGIITDSVHNQSVGYGELIKGKRIERHIAGVPTKAPGELKTIGTSPERKDALEKVTGRAKFAGDIVLPGVLHARIVRPPAHGVVLKSVDTRAAEQAGATVIREDDLVAVLHEHWDTADNALGLVKTEYQSPPLGPNDQNIFDHLQHHGVPPKLVGEKGSVAEGEKLSAQIIERTYLASYVAHAPMEPHTAVAVTSGDRVTVWASTASPFKTQEQVAHGLNIPLDRVRIITPYVGGAFGGKTYSLQAVEAARLAKATGKPVQVLWDRTEEFFYDVFRPAAVVKLRAGLSAAGRIVFWDFNVWGAGDRDTMPFYDIPHQRSTSSHTWTLNDPSGMHPFGVGPWRAPSANTNTHARESHIDVLASKIGADPVEFRMSHLRDSRMRNVLDAAARRFGWKPAKTPSGRGQGVACGIYWGTRVASMAEVAVDRDNGSVVVKRVVLAMDQGLTLNSEGTLQQMEGAIMMGLGYALTEEVRFRNGAIANRNFDSYEMPRFSWLPKIETVVIDNVKTPAQGSGEPVIITSGAVIANAIYDATGARLFQLPMTPERIRRGIQDANA